MRKNTWIAFLFISSLSLVAVAQEKYVTEKMTNKWSVLDMLKDQAGKPVTLYLATGDNVSGTLSPVPVSSSAKTVYITKITGKEFYGALIDLKQIIGVEFHNKAK